MSTRMHHHAILIPVVCCLAIVVIVIGGDPSDGRRSPSPPNRKLTADEAKKALLRMMRAKAAVPMGWFQRGVVEEMEKMSIRPDEDGWYAWSAYRFNPSEDRYSLEIFPSGGGACAFFFKGEFQWENGIWSATLPDLTMTAMQHPAPSP